MKIEDAKVGQVLADPVGNRYEVMKVISGPVQLEVRHMGGLSHTARLSPKSVEQMKPAQTDWEALPMNSYFVFKDSDAPENLRRKVTPTGYEYVSPANLAGQNYHHELLGEAELVEVERPIMAGDTIRPNIGGPSHQVLMVHGEFLILEPTEWSNNCPLVRHSSHYHLVEDN